MEKRFNGHVNESGVYKITNRINNKIYIGSAKCFKNRATSHQSRLRNNKHKNKHLQASWNKHGPSEFLFEVIEVVQGTKEQRYEIEQKYINQIIDEGKWEKTFNFKKKVVQKERSCHSKTPIETKRKLSQKAKEMWAKRTKKERQKFAAVMQNARTKETYEKISNTHKNNTENIIRLTKQIKPFQYKPGKEHPNFGKENKWGYHTPEAIEKIKQYQTGRKKTKTQIEKQSGENHWTKKTNGHSQKLKEKK